MTRELGHQLDAVTSSLVHGITSGLQPLVLFSGGSDAKSDSEKRLPFMRSMCVKI